MTCGQDKDQISGHSVFDIEQPLTARTGRPNNRDELPKTTQLSPLLCMMQDVELERVE